MSQETNMKCPPHSEEAERGVLGSILLDPTRLEGLSIRPEDFYNLQNATLFSELLDMSRAGRVMDALTIGDWLKETNTLDRVGGYDRLIELQDETVVPVHSQQYATTVRERAGLRRQLDIISNASERLYRGEDVSDEVVSALMGEVRSEGQERALHELGEEFIEDCREGQVGHFPWWCNDWTYKLGKMSSDLVILHAPRSTGKTAMMLQWIVDAHLHGQKTPLASIEMLKKELLPRLIANVGSVNTFVMRTRGSITPDEERKASDAVEQIRGLDLCVRDKAMTIDDIRSWAIAEHRKGDCHAIFIDNLLSISDGGKNYQSKTIMYDDFIRKFRDLRDLLKIPVIILAHPNQEGGIAWSKDVENFADIILYLEDPAVRGMVVRGKEVTPRVVEGKHIVAVFQKNRQGIQPVAHLDFVGSTQTFRHIDWEE